MLPGFLYRLEQQHEKRAVKSVNRVAPAPFKLVRVCCIVATFALLAVDLHAQTSTVIGTITDRNGRPAVNVFVSIARQYRYTDVGGRYKVDGVPQGRQHMVIKRDSTVLWEGDVTISGTNTVLNRRLP